MIEELAFHDQRLPHESKKTRPTYKIKIILYLAYLRNINVALYKIYIDS